MLPYCGDIPCGCVPSRLHGNVKERAHASAVAVIASLVSPLSLTKLTDGYWTGCSLHSGKAAPNAREQRKEGPPCDTPYCSPWPFWVSPAAASPCTRTRHLHR